MTGNNFNEKKVVPLIFMPLEQALLVDPTSRLVTMYVHMYV
jgi:hypothetical protein